MDVTTLTSLKDWNKKLLESKAYILVEGKKDVQKLVMLGVKEKRIFIVSNKPVYKVVEGLPEKKEVIILTDLDIEGKKLYNKLKHHLQKHGKKVDSGFRDYLINNTKISHIEGLSINISE